MSSRASPIGAHIAAERKGPRYCLDPTAAAETGDKGMGKGGILEIEREGVVDDTPVPAGAVAQPSAPQVSSSQACMISSWRPNPSGGTAIRTRTGYRRSAAR